MKIAIVCGHFLPSMGYLEVHLANAFHQLNHEVKVITSHVIPSYVKSVGKLTDDTPYLIERLPAEFTLGQMVKSKGLVNAVESFDPDLVICIGVGKLFPQPLYKLKNRKFKLITLLGDNEETYTTRSVVKKVKNTLVQQVFKKKVYLQAIRSSDLLLPYTPSTVDIIADFIDKKTATVLKLKSKQISLGFDAEQHFYSKSERVEQRKALAIVEEESLLVTATRVVPEKGLEKIVDLVDAANKKGVSISYLLIGFQDDDYGKELKQYIAQKEFKDKIICKPFSSAEQTRKYYNSADVAIYSRAAISIFEALSTGLFILLPEQKNISHILTSETGIYFESLSIEVLLESIENRKEGRSKRVNEAKKFSYRNLAKQILELSEV